MSPSRTSTGGSGRAELAAGRAQERRVLIIAAVVLLALAVVGVAVYRTTLAPTAASVGPGLTAGQTATDVVAGRPLLIGAADAEVTLTLYEDFHCPHCADLQAELGPTIDTLVQAGTLRVALLPMSFVDDGSTRAANAMACAAAAGFGGAYHDGLFADPGSEWNTAQLQALGARVGAGQADEAFDTCVAGSEQSGWVTSINTAATQANVTQTPTVFLDDAPVDIAGLTGSTLTDSVEQAARG